MKLISMIALLLSTVLQSQQVGPQNATLSGFVVKLGTADPVPEAGVELTRAGGAPAKSFVVRASTEGKFVFKDVPPGEYRLAAAQTGFIRFEYGQRGPHGRGLTIALTAGQDTKDIRIGLPQTAAISGHIYDRKGAPLANVQVLALKYGYRGPARALLAVKSSNTNDLGEYRLFGLPPGQYAISALPLRGTVRDTITEIMSDGYQITRSVAPPAGALIAPASDDVSIPIYYPGFADPQSAIAVNVKSSDNIAAIDIAMNPPATRRVRGTVQNLPGPAELTAATTGGPPRLTASPVSVGIVPRNPNGPAMYIDGAPPVVQSSVDPRTGAFELRGVLPGSYYISAEFSGRNNGAFGMTPVEVGGEDLDNVTVSLTPGFDVYLRVTVDGQPLNRDDERFDFFIVSEAPRRSMIAQPAPQRAGALVVHGVTPGDYRVAPNFNSIDYMGGTMRLSGQDVSRGFHLDGLPQNEIQVELVSNKASGSITGTVINNKLELTPNVAVALVPKETGAYKNAWTDSNGRFRFTEVEPGDYTVYAWEDVEQFAWQVAEFMRPFVGRGKAVHVDDGGAVSTQVNVIPYVPGN